MGRNRRHHHERGRGEALRLVHADEPDPHRTSHNGRGKYRRDYVPHDVTGPETIDPEGNHDDFNETGTDMDKARHSQVALDVFPPPVELDALQRSHREAGYDKGVRQCDEGLR